MQWRYVKLMLLQQEGQIASLISPENLDPDSPNNLPIW